MIIDTDVLIWYMRGNPGAKEIVQIDQDISARAIFYVQEYFLSHSMQMADALIAATAVAVGNTLLTASDKTYTFVPNLELETFVP